MTPTFRSTAKPMDHTTGLQPMHPHDEAFARRHANDNPRPRFRDVMRDRGGLLFAAIVIVAVGVVMASHGVLR